MTNKTRKSVSKDIERLFDTFLTDSLNGDTEPITEDDFHVYSYRELNKTEKRDLIKKLKERAYKEMDSLIECFIEEVDIVMEEKIAEDEDEEYRVKNQK